MTSNYKRLGDYIRRIEEKNTELSVDTLLGVSMTKKFIPSVANTVGVNMANYQIVRKNQFACKLMSVGRDEQLPVDLLKTHDSVIVSSAYYVFETKDEEVLNSDYLMMWFRRKETDRWVGYISGGDVRGGISWDTFCEMTILIPSIQVQRKVVRENHAIQSRIKERKQIIKKSEELSKSVFKHWFLEFEFPNEHNKPFKTSGGTLEYNSQFENELPIGWRVGRLDEVSTIRAGGDKPKAFSESESNEFNIPIYSNSSKKRGLFGFTNKAKIFESSVTISARGAIIGYTELRLKPFVPIVRLIVVTPKNEMMLNYLYYTIKNFRFDDLSSAQGQLTKPDISAYELIIPDDNSLIMFHNLNKRLFKQTDNARKEIELLEKVLNIQFQKMSSLTNNHPKKAL